MCCSTRHAPIFHPVNPQVVTCFHRKGKLGRIVTSTLYRRRQETAENSLRDALHRLQAGVSFASVGVLRRTSCSVDELVANVQAERQVCVDNSRNIVGLLGGVTALLH